MADLLLQDFRDLFSRNLVQVLFTEKTKMFGEEKFHAKKEGRQLVRLKATWRFNANVREIRRKKC
jgi:hypothetical protein